MSNKEKDQTERKMSEFVVALGIIFGSAIGTILGVILNYYVAISAIFGAGIGLVIGAIIFMNYKKE